MTSGILPAQQIQTTPMIDPSQQSQEQCFALAIPEQPQDQYIPNNQVFFVPVSTPPVQTHHHHHIRILTGPLVKGGLTAAVTYSLLHLSNSIMNAAKRPQLKLSNNWILFTTATVAILDGILQGIKIEKTKAESSHHDITITQGI